MSDRKPIDRKKRLRLSRRDLFKVAQVAGLGAATGSLALVGRNLRAEESKPGTCRICTMHCGIIATRKGDQLIRVEGDPESRTRGFICHHAQALHEIVHAHDRVEHPLKRDGNHFRPISWQQALEEIAERMNRIKARDGARAVAVQTGWPFVRHPLIGMLHRFCQAFGTPNLASVASLCEASDRMGKALTVGLKYFPDLSKSKTLVVWGANPTFSAPPFAHLVSGMAMLGRNLIVIDPTKTELARAATLHLQVRPGTDGALALGLMNVVLSEGLQDQKFIDEETSGFEQLAALVKTYSPERVSEITTVPAEKIARAARLFATEGPSSVWDGLGVEHHANGVQTVRAISILEALCGQLRHANLLNPAGPSYQSDPLPALYRMRTPEPVPPPVADRPIGYDDYPLYEIYNRQAQGNLYARAILDDKPYRLRGLILVGSNAFITAPDSHQMKRAADKLDLLVSVDPFLTASGELSDYVLPASTFAEAPDVDADDSEIAPSGLVPEQHSSWPDWKIIFELARVLGLKQYFPWNSFREAIKAHHVAYMSDPAHTLYAARGKDRPTTTTPKFPTPSGKVELYSETLERFGHDPLPDWKAPLNRPDPAQEFPLILVSGPRTRPFINSQFHTIPSIARKMPEPVVALHPTAATRFGVTDKESVAVVSPYGRIVLRVNVSESVHPETAVIPSGWAQANANELTSSDSLDPISGFPAFRSGVCRIEKL